LKLNKNEEIKAKIKENNNFLKNLDELIFSPAKLAKKIEEKEHNVKNRLTIKSFIIEILLLFLPGTFLFLTILQRMIAEGKFFNEIMGAEFLIYFVGFSGVLWMVKIIFGTLDWAVNYIYQKIEKKADVKKENIDESGKLKEKNNLFEKLRISNYIFTPITIFFLFQLIAFSIADSQYSLYRMSLWFSIEFILGWIWQSVYIFWFYFNKSQSKEPIAFINTLLWLGLLMGLLILLEIFSSAGPWHYNFMLNLLNP